MNKQRLLTLANFLRHEVPEARFNLSSWAGSFMHQFQEGEDLLSPFCGTSACAMGWATTIPMFAALGLSLKKNATGANTGVLSYNGSLGFSAAAKFMDIDPSDAHWLFNEEEYCDQPSAVEVADRIEAYVTSNGDRIIR